MPMPTQEEIDTLINQGIELAAAARAKDAANASYVALQGVSESAIAAYNAALTAQEDSTSLHTKFQAMQTAKIARDQSALSLDTANGNHGQLKSTYDLAFSNLFRRVSEPEM